MRIVSGKYRGKILTPPQSKNIRPTLDKVKQALFTKLQFEIPNANVLDLFCGSGALGIEAVSRGAKQVVFVDNNAKSIDLTKKNLASIGFSQNQKTSVKVLLNSYEKALEYLAKQNYVFDIIILDPPYEHTEYYQTALKLIKDKNLLVENGIIVCERLKGIKIEQGYFNLLTTKNYGTVALDYFSFPFSEH